VWAERIVGKTLNGKYLNIRLGAFWLVTNSDSLNLDRKNLLSTHHYSQLEVILNVQPKSWSVA
jgi:hypothetical protein